MLYAKVVLGLPVEGPFDYIVPGNCYKKIKAGSRVWVSFGPRKMLGYAVKVTKATSIKKLKAISDILDDSPVLDKNMLLLTKELSDYYCCSWGEAIEAALPESLRKGKLLPKPKPQEPGLHKNAQNDKEVILLHDLGGIKRWEKYIQEIKSCLAEKKSAIILLPDIGSVIKAGEIIKDKVGCAFATLYRKETRGDLEDWVKVRDGEVQLAIGTRAAIFAPFRNLGLVIIDEEESSLYKQDQVPHYHARSAALMRVGIEKAKLILGSSSPSLESLNLAKGASLQKKQYILLPREDPYPEIKIMDISNSPPLIKGGKTVLSGYLQSSIANALSSGGKVLLFLNRKGFATAASCFSCGTTLKCPRCSVNLVYYFKGNILKCRYCNFKMSPLEICPVCNSGYIKYFGAGTEKMESELSRIFPSARIKLLDNPKEASIADVDVFISTEAIIGDSRLNFGLIGVISIDNSLNRIDLRSSEKAFSLLTGLIKLTSGKVVIQTALPNHHIFKALIDKEPGAFYDEELKQRRELNFPPYGHLCIVKLRGKKESRAREASIALSERLKKYNAKDRGLNIVSVNPQAPAKLRGNFYWQILISSHSAKKMSKFLKLRLRNFRYSGIIVTVDMDPV